MRYNEKLAVLHSSLKPLRDILGNVNVAKHIDIAKRNEVAPDFLKNLFYSGPRVSLETYLESLSLICKYKGYAHYEIETDIDTNIDLNIYDIKDIETTDVCVNLKKIL
jgi:hypothetical protein